MGVSWNPISSDETTDFICAIRSICNTYNLSYDDIKHHLGIRNFDKLSESVEIKVEKQLPVKIYVPQEMSPVSEQHKNKTGSWLDITAVPNPTLDDSYYVGLYEMSIKTKGKKIRFWRYRSYRDYGPLGKTVFFIEHKNLKKFYKILLKSKKGNQIAIKTPILDNKILNDIWKNSIGFLEGSEKYKNQYAEHKIPCKRGILISGKSGSGKTLICKWLRQHCMRKGLSHSVVTTEDYRKALSRGDISSIFQLPEKKNGIIFFDDMEIMFQDRSSGNPHLSDFLTQLDGIETSEGVVFIFTSNRIQELDEAFVRPGRIDLFLIFDAPSEKLRRRFVTEFFHPDILKQIDIEEIVKRTASSNVSRDTDSSYTFAEIEEVRKLMSMDFISGKNVDVDKTFKEFERHRNEFIERSNKLGFGTLKKDSSQLLLEDDEDIFYEDINILGFPR